MKRIFFLSLAIIFFITNISYADTLRIPISGVKRETETISKLLQPDADATTKLASNHKIISGEQAYKEFQAEIGKFRTNNITEQYRDSLIRALQYLINVRFSGVDRKQLNRILRDLKSGRIKICGTESIVKGEKDYLLGKSNLDKNEIFLSTDLIAELQRYNSQELLDEYFRFVITQTNKSSKLAEVVQKHIDVLVKVEGLRLKLLDSYKRQDRNIKEFSIAVEEFKKLYQESPQYSGRLIGLLILICRQFIEAPADDPCRLSYAKYANPAKIGYELLTSMGTMIVASGYQENIGKLVYSLVDMPFEGLNDPKDFYSQHNSINWQAEQVLMLLSIISKAPEEKNIIFLVSYLTFGLNLRGNFITENERQIFLTYEDVINNLQHESSYNIYRQLNAVLLSTFSGHHGSSMYDPMRVKTRQSPHNIGLCGEIRQETHINLSEFALVKLEKLLQFYANPSDISILKGYFSEENINGLFKEGPEKVVSTELDLYSFISEHTHPVLHQILSNLAEQRSMGIEDINISLLLEASDKELDAAYKSAENMSSPALGFLQNYIWVYRYLSERYRHKSSIDIIMNKIVGINQYASLKDILFPSEKDLHNSDLFKALKTGNDLAAIEELVRARLRLRNMIYDPATKQTSEQDKEESLNSPDLGDGEEGGGNGFLYKNKRLNFCIVDRIFNEIEEILIPRLVNKYFNKVEMNNIEEALGLLATLINGLYNIGIGDLTLIEHADEMEKSGNFSFYGDQIGKGLNELIAQEILSNTGIIQSIVVNTGMEQLGSEWIKALISSMPQDEDLFSKFVHRIPGHMIRNMFARNEPYFYYVKSLLFKISELSSREIMRKSILLESGPHTIVPNFIEDSNGAMILSSRTLSRKGKNLLAMKRLGLQVPFGWVYPAPENSSLDYVTHEWIPNLIYGVRSNVAHLESNIKRRNCNDKYGTGFGNTDDPIILVVRSGASITLPGQLITVTNIGLNKKTVLGLVKRIGTWAAYDSLRRFYQEWGMYICGMDRSAFDNIIEDYKKIHKMNKKSSLNGFQMRELAELYLTSINKSGYEIPDDSYEQLNIALEKVALGWYSKDPKSLAIRTRFGMEDEPATIIVQAQVFGSAGKEGKMPTSGAGVVFSSADRQSLQDIRGEYYPNSQGSDIADGVIIADDISRLQQLHPDVYNELVQASKTLQAYANKIQQIEFTIQRNRNTGRPELFFIQTRDHIVQYKGLRFAQGEEERLTPFKVAQGKGVSGGAFRGLVLLSDHIDKIEDVKKLALAKGLDGVVLIMNTAEPEDTETIIKTDAFITVIGTITGHSSDIASTFNKCAIVGVNNMRILPAANTVEINGKLFNEEDTIIINGNNGIIYRDPGFYVNIIDDKRDIATVEQQKLTINMTTSQNL